MSPRLWRRIAFALVLSALAVFGLAMPASAAVTDTQVIGTASGALPFEVAVSPDGQYVYVTYPGTNQIARFDTSTNAFDAVITLPPDSNPWDIAVSPDGGRIYVTTQGQYGDPVYVNSTFVTINAATFTVTSTVDLTDPSMYWHNSMGASTMVLSPDGAHAYIFLNAGDILVDVNTSNGNVNQWVYVNPYALCDGGCGRAPDQLAITPDGAYIYETQSDTVSLPTVSRVIKISTANFAASPTVLPTGGVLNFPQQVAITPNGTKMFVANYGNNLILVYDPRSGAFLGSFDATTADTTPQRNAFMTISPNSAQLVVSNSGGFGQLLFYSTSTYQLLYSTVTDPYGSYDRYQGLEFNPTGTLLFEAFQADALGVFTIDPPVGIPKPALASTGRDVTPIIVTAGILLLIGACAFAYAMVLRKRRND